MVFFKKFQIQYLLVGDDIDLAVVVCFYDGGFQFVIYYIYKLEYLMFF